MFSSYSPSSSPSSSSCSYSYYYSSSVSYYFSFSSYLFLLLLWLFLFIFFFIFCFIFFIFITIFMFIFMFIFILYLAVLLGTNPSHLWMNHGCVVGASWDVDRDQGEQLLWKSFSQPRHRGLAGAGRVCKEGIDFGCCADKCCEVNGCWLTSLSGEGENRAAKFQTEKTLVIFTAFFELTTGFLHLRPDGNRFSSAAHFLSPCHMHALVLVLVPSECSSWRPLQSRLHDALPCHVSACQEFKDLMQEANGRPIILDFYSSSAW